MKNIYLIEGVSGTGKTTVCQELQKRGYRAVEADEDIAHYADPKTGLPTNEKIPDNWIWDKEKFNKAIEQEGNAPIFICGGAMNQEDFKHHFNKVFTLHIDDETLKYRLLNRTNNDFGKHPDELALQLEWNKGAVKYSKERGTILIDATKPVSDVVDNILFELENNLNWTKTLNKDRASGIIIKDSKILLIHRIREDKEYWVFPGGGVEENESIEKALDRELSEELSIIAKEKRFLFKIENAGRSEHHFLISKYEGEPKLGGPEAERMTDKNQYILAWLPIDKLNSINLLPEKVKEMIASKLN